MKRINHHIIPDTHKYSRLEMRFMRFTQRDWDNHCEYLIAILFDRARIIFSEKEEHDA